MMHWPKTSPMSKRQAGYIVIKIDELHPHPRRRRKLIRDIVESPDYSCALVDALVIEEEPHSASAEHLQSTAQ